jgi:hypothetical protein
LVCFTKTKAKKATILFFIMCFDVLVAFFVLLCLAFTFFSLCLSSPSPLSFAEAIIEHAAH